MSVNSVAFGIIATRAAAKKAVESLKAAGYRNMGISILFPKLESIQSFLPERHAKPTKRIGPESDPGALVDGTFEWLEDIGQVAISDVGHFIAAGPIKAALAENEVVGTKGGIFAALVGLGIPKYEAHRFEARIKKGAILLAVECDSAPQSKHVKNVLEATGAEGISSTEKAKICV